MTDIKNLTRKQINAIRRDYCERGIGCQELWVLDGETWCCWRTCPGFKRAAKLIQPELKKGKRGNK